MRKGSLITVIMVSLANGILLGAALTTSRPGCYLVVAIGAGTLLNLAYVMAGRLWQERP